MNNHDAQVKADRESRRLQDQLKGLSKAKGAQRGDYGWLRKEDKILNDYRKFKNPKDREKIKKEIAQNAKENREYKPG